MTEPDRLSPMPAANQIPAGEESQTTTGAAGAPRNDGPEYGAMRSQFPKNYDPYQFGHAEEPVKPVQNGGDSTGQEAQNPFAMFVRAGRSTRQTAGCRTARTARSTPTAQPVWAQSGIPRPISGVRSAGLLSAVA